MGSTKFSHLETNLGPGCRGQDSLRSSFLDGTREIREIEDDQTRLEQGPVFFHPARA